MLHSILLVKSRDAVDKAYHAEVIDERTGDTIYTTDGFDDPKEAYRRAACWSVATLKEQARLNAAAAK